MSAWWSGNDVFNREYQIRATKRALAQEFYRPAVRPDPRPTGHRGKRTLGVSPLQMKLDFSQNRPLNDVFPEAYE